MILRLNENPTIENLRNYPMETIGKLRGLLAAGAKAWADPRRRDFYDVENDSQVFYIHLTPHGKILLIAVWRKPAVEARVKTFAAQPYPCIL